MTEATILALVEAGAPSVTAPPYLADKVLAVHRRARFRRRSSALALAGLLVGVGGGTVAARSTGQSRFVNVYEPSGTMGTTVATGESLVADRHLVPTYGDVVLIRLTNAGVTFEAIRRVIGLPGDKVACPLDADGRCHAWTRNGLALKEAYVRGDDGSAVQPSSVAPGGIYVLGDQRDNAVDSRQVRPARIKDVVAVGVQVRTEDGRVRPIAGAPTHDGPGSKNVDPAVQPTSATASD